MSFSELIPLTAAIVNLMLTVFILTRGLRATVNRVYGLWGASMTVWNLGTYFLFTVKDESSAYFWACFVQAGVVFLPVSNLHLCLQIAGRKAGKWIWLMYGVSFLLGTLIFTGDFITGVRDVGYAYYSVAGPAFYAFVASYAFAGFMGVLLLYRAQRSASRLQRTRIRWLLTAMILIELFGTNDILPIFGVDRYPLTQTQIYPLGSLAAIFYSIIIGYTVLQHRLLDIHVALGRIAGRVVRFSFLFIISLSMLLIVALAFPASFPPFAIFSSLAIITASSLVASMIFPRLFGQGDEVLERRILGDRFAYQDEIKLVTQSLSRFDSEDSLLATLDQFFEQHVQAKTHHLIVRSRKADSFVLYLDAGSELLQDVEALKENSPAVSVFADSRLNFLPLNMGYVQPGETDLEIAARSQLQHLGGEIAIPITNADIIYGIFILGEKQSGDPYTPFDIELLLDLARQTGLMIHHIRINKKLIQQEEMELMGRMSRGLAHDLNNLVTPISTFLQLLQEQNGRTDGLEELIPVASRNIQAVRAYIREALLLSNTNTINLGSGNLDGVIRASIEISETKLRSREMSITYDGDPLAEALLDAVLIQRVFDNLISNAIDASPNGGSIEITLRRLPRPRSGSQWYRIEVSDHGHGISRENIKRVFTPYFTTKDKGDKTRGFGLGLAICRRIVHLHHGQMALKSEEGKGTTVVVELPAAPPASAAPSLREPAYQTAA